MIIGACLGMINTMSKLADVMTRFDGKMVTLTINKQIEDEQYIESFEVSNRADTIVICDRVEDKIILEVNKADIEIIYTGDIYDWYIEFEANSINYLLTLG